MDFMDVMVENHSMDVMVAILWMWGLATTYTFSHHGFFKQANLLSPLAHASKRTRGKFILISRDGKIEKARDYFPSFGKQRVRSAGI